MSGHNKWSQIKHKKAKTDSQKGKAFSKIVREIIVSARAGGGDPNGNSRLRLAIQKAKEANMPSDNVKRAIQKGTGALEGVTYEEILFEAYGPGGVALLIETLTDNRNRTVSNLRALLTKASGSLATKGAVAYLFEKKGVINFSKNCNQDTVVSVATDAGAEDVDLRDDGGVEVLVQPHDYETVKKAFDDAKLVYENAEITMLAKTLVPLAEDQAKKVLQLIEHIEDDEDVQSVYTNLEISDSIAQGFIS